MTRMHLPAPSALAVVPALVALLVSVGSAQVAGGSETKFVLGHALTGGGGTGVGGKTTTLEFGLSQVATGLESSSLSYTMRNGVSWVTPSITTDAPIVAGVRPGLGLWSGSEPAAVFGYNFLAPGAGALAVDVGGAAATGVSVVSNVEAALTTPVATDLFGNPVGFAPVGVTNALGTHTVADGFLSTPAVIERNDTYVGGSLDIAFFSAPGNFYLVARKPILLPPPGVPIGNLQGSLLLLPPVPLLVDVSLTSTGLDLASFPVPDDPVLNNATLYLQGVALTDIFTLTGSFTTVLPIVFLPQP